MTNILIILVIVFIVYAYFKGSSKPKRTTKRALPKKVTREDHESFIRFVSEETVSPELKITDTIHSDIPKDKNPKIKIYLPITDDEFEYNVAQRKWKDGLSPFDYRTPSTFINRLQTEWEGINGPLPERKKPKKITKVDFNSKKFELPKFEEQALSKLPKDLIVEGSSGKKYSVNLSQLSCTCPDFIKRRKSFSGNDVRRVCKHIAKTIVEEKLTAKVSKDNFIRIFIRKASNEKRGVPVFQNMVQIQINEETKGPDAFYILLEKGSLPWINVVLLLKTTYNRFGYNIEEKRWAHGNNPFPHGEKAKYNFVIQQYLKELANK